MFRFGFVLMLLSTVPGVSPRQRTTARGGEYPKAAQDLPEGTYPKHSISAVSGLSHRKTQRRESLSQL